MKRDGEHGVPGEGKGRRDEVGRSGIWPVSGPAPPAGDMPVVEQGELVDGPRGSTPAADAFETDPVCGKRIEAAAGEPSTFNGHAYYFDSPECRRLFEEAPERFATLPDRRR